MNSTLIYFNKKDTMNQTRKQIIELIEPYMDKTEHSWCYWQFEDETPTVMSDMLSSQEIYDSLEWTDSRILGHYSIDAVLKYIRDIKWKCIICDWDDFRIIGYGNIYFENKPLHLYTDQEDKDLLELLETLWQNN